jgi:site-specific DNA-cytosine methylase
LFSQQGGGLVPAMMFKVRGGSPVETGEQGGTPGKGAGKGFLGSEEKAFTIATAPDQWLAQPTAFSFDSLASNSMKSSNPNSGCREVDVSKTIDTTNPSPNKNQGGIAIVQAIPIQDGREMEKNQNGIGVGNPGDPAYTLDTTGAQAAAVPFRKSKRASSTTDNETWVEADASNTLNNFDLGDTRTTHAVVACSDVSPTISSGAPFSKTGNERVECEAFIVQASELRLRGQITEKDVCPTITANAKQGDTDPLAVHAIAFQPGNLVRKAGADPSTEVFPTLSKDSGDQNPHVAHQVYENSRRDAIRIYEGVSPTLQSFMGTGGCNVPMVQPQVPMAVRRLTPVECERLQGFSDNWSRISWKGKPAEECPDGPRYKACGNSMAVPVMRWIGEAIARYEAKRTQV